MEGGDRRFILDEVLEEGRNNYAHATLVIYLVEKRRGIKGLIYEDILEDYYELRMKVIKYILLLV